MSAAVFYLDARVLGMPATTDSWVTELDDMLLRTRAIYPLEIVVILPPLLEATVRRRIGLLSYDDLRGASSASPAAVSGSVVLDAQVRKMRGIQAGWLLAINGSNDRLEAAVMPIRLLPVGLRVDPPPVDDVEEPLLMHARRSSGADS